MLPEPVTETVSVIGFARGRFVLVQARKRAETLPRRPKIPRAGGRRAGAPRQARWGPSAKRTLGATAEKEIEHVVGWRTYILDGIFKRAGGITILPDLVGKKPVRISVTWYPAPFTLSVKFLGGGRSSLRTRKVPEADIPDWPED